MAETAGERPRRLSVFTINLWTGLTYVKRFGGVAMVMHEFPDHQVEERFEALVARTSSRFRFAAATRLSSRSRDSAQ